MMPAFIRDSLIDPARTDALDLLYREVGATIRGRELDHVFNVLVNHLAGLCAANGIDHHRAIDSFKEAHTAYREKMKRSAVWVPP